MLDTHPVLAVVPSGVCRTCVGKESVPDKTAQLPHARNLPNAQTCLLDASRRSKRPETLKTALAHKAHVIVSALCSVGLGCTASVGGRAELSLSALLPSDRGGRRGTSDPGDHRLCPTWGFCTGSASTWHVCAPRAHSWLPKSHPSVPAGSHTSLFCSTLFVALVISNHPAHWFVPSVTACHSQLERQLHEGRHPDCPIHRCHPRARTASGTSRAH